MFMIKNETKNNIWYTLCRLCILTGFMLLPYFLCVEFKKKCSFLILIIGDEILPIVTYDVTKKSKFLH